ncbi:NADH dehydrogenase ubiquinone 1 alpha subcomplex subunit 12 [Hondaea fermentalgiana]|uniref:NADH dehydrogenase [ubiquinone] 1 alpha subcomplex subunit 12 n=1 Tax=Hondaea fermentalgiana TaxID=2315210 RepID=A0A2R5GF21_9STRA|nr:NADH dehydrogenase ubiquinone 1 alpha subcomplex subunit 12 [Hondaea fermentalgiana]|eukprot:GBG29532.1 NADH dehydrogenase ubiquinone 1 alpha subcomplex subunit 12 [Hondaea fermentalgiana]
MNYIKAVQTWGLKDTLRKFYQLKQIKFGTYVGTDEFGNKYYENLEEQYGKQLTLSIFASRCANPHRLRRQQNDNEIGQHRWVEPARLTHGTLWDASEISPTWHGWLHSVTDKVPDSVEPTTETGYHIIDGVDTPVRHHINIKHRRDWRKNPTLQRERGYNVDHYFSKAGVNDYYVQPGTVASPLFEEKGPKIEVWGAAPEPKSNVVGEPEKEKEPWELFWAQRKRMNEEKGVAK